MRKRELLLVMMLIVAMPNIAFASEWGALTPYVPADGVIKGDVMDVKPSERAMVLLGKFKAGIAAHQQWYVEYIQKYEGDLPYHQNMGLTKKEYEEMKTGLEKLDFQKVGKIEIVIKKTARGHALTVKGHKDFPLDGLVISDDGKKVSTPYGALDQRTDVDTTSNPTPIGSLKGVEWKKEASMDFATQTGEAVSFVIGRRSESPHGLLDYNVKSFKPSKRERYDILIFYDLP